MVSIVIQIFILIPSVAEPGEKTDGGIKIMIKMKMGGSLTHIN